MPQVGSKKSPTGEAGAIFANFSAFMTSFGATNLESAPLQDILSVRLGGSQDGSLEKGSAQEFFAQLIGNDFVQVDDKLEKLISEKGFDGLLNYIEDVGELAANINFNPTEAFVDSRIGVLKTEGIVVKNHVDLNFSTFEELNAAIELFKKSIKNIGLNENAPELGSLEANNLTFISDLIRSVPIELELKENDTSAVFFDIRDLKNNLTSATFSSSTQPGSEKLPETLLIPQVVPIKVENINADKNNYEAFVAVKVDLLDLEGGLGPDNIIDLADGPDGDPGARLLGVTKNVEINPDMDVKSKLLISLSIPEDANIKKLPDFVKLNISLGLKSHEAFNLGASPQSENPDLDGSPLLTVSGRVVVGPSAVDPTAVDPTATGPTAVGVATVGPAAFDPAAVGPTAGGPAAGGATAFSAAAVSPIPDALGINLTADLGVLASELLSKLKEISGAEYGNTKIITKTVSTDAQITNFQMPQVLLPEKNTFILKHKNDEISVFNHKQKPIDLVQNRIFFDDEIKLASSMRNDMRSDFITSVMALESHLKYSPREKSDKFNFFKMDVDANGLEQKNISAEQKIASNIFNPKAVLEASDALRMKSISVSNAVPKDDFLKISQANTANPLSLKGDNQLVNSTNSFSNLGGLSSSINNKILLHDAQYASRISMLVVDKVLKGQENFEIHLEPKSFGKIKINVLMDKQALDIRMVTETQAAASLLRGSEDSLNQITNQNGMKLASFSVGMQGGSDQQRQNSNQNRNRVSGKASSMLERTKIQNLQTETSGGTSPGLNLIA
jgi:hypothetical protein